MDDVDEVLLMTPPPWWVHVHGVYCGFCQQIQVRLKCSGAPLHCEEKREIESISPDASDKPFLRAHRTDLGQRNQARACGQKQLNTRVLKP